MKTILVFAGCAASAASAQSLFISQPNTSYDARYGTSRWSQTTSYIDGAFSSVTLGGDISDLANLLNYDRLWLDQRLDTPLSPTEQANLVAYAATGRRIVIIGENNNWPSWNASILGPFGGSWAGEFSGIANATLNHEITDGVNSVDVIAGSVASGGTSLFDQNFATLWGDGNVLTVLDSNLWDDAYLGSNDNLRFTHNAIDWLVVPAPGAMALLGLAGLTAARRRR